MGTGNTVGKIVGQPPVPEKKAEEANPVVSAETEEEKGFLDSLFDIPLNSRDRGRWLAVSALHHDQYESFRAIAEGYGDEALAGFDGTYDNADIQFASIMIGISAGGRRPGGTRAGKTGSAKTGRFPGMWPATRMPALAGAGGMPYGEGLQILNAERRAAGSSVRNAKSVKKKTDSGGKSKGKKKDPCKHLRKGSGEGGYRGGAHSGTKKPANDGLDSHHLPADDVSPLSKNNGPAIQMEPRDHKVTGSNGSSHEAARYRMIIQELLDKGEWRKAMAIEIWDIKNNNKRKYNKAIQEMLLYYKCLEENKLLKNFKEKER
ncbi:hypothetical protein QB714_003647 [Salmonella enterica]|nr:hypothetical protein [Salmonella enterica]EKS4717792.1 hypothetical protein [Salmonella enterica]EKS4722565.1 hypothetical protein [Salmonella enterica]EKS4735841.1 hypothetical protein [Salmonella enterica]EKS4772937.1 hypothetical protein [Salmonella enterica]